MLYLDLNWSYDAFVGTRIWHAVISSQSVYNWLLWSKYSCSWAHLLIWFWSLVSTRGSFPCFVLEKCLYLYSYSRFLAISWVNAVFGSTGPQWWRVLDTIHESMEEIFVWHDGRMGVIRMEVGSVGVDYVEFWVCSYFSVVVGSYG